MRRALRGRVASTQWRDVRRASRENSPEAMEAVTGVPAAERARRRAAVRHRRQRGDLLRPRRHRAQPGLDDGDGHRQPRDGHRQRRPRRRRREPAARPEQRAGLVRHGLVPARAARLPPRLRRDRARAVRGGLGRDAATPSRACASRTCSTPRSTAASRACTCRARTSRSPIPNTQHVTAALSAMECIVVQDLFLNETAKYAHVFLPGSSFLEKDGTFTNAERRISRVRKVMPPLAGLRRLGSRRSAARQRARLPDALRRIRREIMDEIARADADLRRRQLREARRARQHPVAVQRRSARRHADHARRRLRARQGPFIITEYVPTRREGRRAASRCC